ncbi:hypothetical protein ANO11243_095070 [Dothideomycetidae sp. 11243]|nr:hypothetical protein ANO11243_095070 [fungal sp. No.11243]
MSLCSECRFMLRQGVKGRVNSLQSRYCIPEATSRRLLATSTNTSARREDEARYRESSPRISASRDLERGQKGDLSRRAQNGRFSRKEKSLADALDAEMTLEQKRHYRMELLWLKDPAKLAQTVRKLLAQDNFPKALNLVRLASTDDNKPIMAWNVLVSYVAQKREFKSAFRLYNEMKKRRQFPDSYTVIHIMRGLAQQPVSKEQVKLALQLHDSLDAENSRVERLAIHTNAAMQVCINAGDLDTMWTLASKLPDHGKAAADEGTFGTILTSLRRAVETKAKTDPDYNEIVSRSIEDGRKIWQDAIRRWKRNSLNLDESLLCNYLMLLLLKPGRETSTEILSIMEETTGIGPNEDTSNEVLKGSLAPGNSRKLPRFVLPGRVLLSVLLKAYLPLCSYSGTSIRPAKSYWDFFTTRNTVIPDLDNYHSVLRIYAALGDSQNASEAIHEMLSTGDRMSAQTYGNLPKIAPGRTAYLLALTACSKETGAHRRRSRNIPRGFARTDADNRSKPDTAQLVHFSSADLEFASLGRANKVFDAMIHNSKPVPAKPIGKFLECAIVTHSARSVYAALLKIMPILDAMLSEMAGSGATNTTSPFSKRAYMGADGEDVAALAKLALETVRTLLSVKGREALGLDGMREDQPEMIKLRTWLRRLGQGSDEIVALRQPARLADANLTEMKHLEVFKEALRSKHAAMAKKRVVRGTVTRAFRSAASPKGRRS